MKKNTHPLKQTTTIIMKNGSSLKKNWIFFKEFLKLDEDFLKKKMWTTLKKNKN